MKCPSCGYENSQDARYCGLCQASFGSFAREPSAPYGLAPALKPSKEAVKQVLRSQAKGENWFQRHLNWTWALPQLFLLIASLFVMTMLTLSMAEAIRAPTESSFMLPFAGFVVSVTFIIPLLMSAAAFGIGAWVLKRKNRSLWWLLIFLIPSPAAWLNGLLGSGALVAVWIVFLRLENRSELVALPAPPSSSIQPGLASPGLGAQYGKYGS